MNNIINEKPVICAVCDYTGKHIMLKDGKHLTCALCNNKPIYGSKPNWCPLNNDKEKQLTLF